jgi:hypothetical protein
MREQHCARRRRESPSGKDPTVELRYIILLHLIFALEGVVLGCRSFPVRASPKKPCAGDLKHKITDEPEREKSICLRGRLSIRKCFPVETDFAASTTLRRDALT